MNSPRQTLSYLQDKFRRAGVLPQIRFGQNFLIDLNLIDLIMRSADLSTKDVVLEIGTGMGSLTTKMALYAGSVVTVEIDPMMAQLAKEELAPYGNVTILQRDALRNKNNLHDEVLETVRQKMNAIPGSRFKLVANLPYNVATPIISNLLQVEPLVDKMVVTIQKELAERIAAKPKTKDYSALSIWIQSQCDVEIVRVLPPSVFWPRPKVDSAILSITPNAALRARVVDREYFHQTVRALFFHRRKFLRGVVVSAMKDKLSKERVDQLLLEANLDANSRAEELPVEQIIDLVDRLRIAEANETQS
ncbi:MAG: ribosomal RNA small subunit methyltransferase A [Planctomycetaceae bacterium]|nr:ribosomal RNA small subunit methyltransferase A [Planctomycetaceae bacterium]